MSVQSFELSWQVGETRHTLHVGPDGVPHLSPAEGAPPAVPTGPLRRGKAWSEADETHLRDGFGRGQAVADLAEELGRSNGAVRARLVRMGLLDPEEAGLRYPVARG